MVRFSDLKNQRDKSSAAFRKTLGIEPNQEIKIVQTDLANRGVRVGEDEITEYLKTHGPNSEEVVKYFKSFYGQNTGVNRGQDETSYPSTIPSTKLSKRSTRSERLNLELNEIMSIAAKTFRSELIDKSLKREKETINTVSKYSTIGIRTKKDFLNFMNGSYQNKDNITGIIKTYENSIDLRLASLELMKAMGSKGRAAPTVDPSSAFKSIALENNKIIDKILDEMRKNVIYAPQFVGYLIALERKITSKDDPYQAERAGKTVLEFVAANMLRAKNQYFLQNPTLESASSSSGTKSNVENIGQLLQEDFKEWVINKYGGIGKINNPEKFIEDVVKYYKENLIDTKNAQGIVSLAQKIFYSPKGSTPGSITKLSVVDLNFKVGGRDIFIDSKLGLSKLTSSNINQFGGRYTPSSGVSSTLEKISTTFVSKKSLRPFMTNIDLALKYFITLIETNKFTNDSLKESAFSALITYSFISSYEFIDHYRERGLEVADSKFNYQQPDLLLTSAGFVWYSDFFEVLYQAYFKSKDGVSAKIKTSSKEIKQLYTNFKQKEEFVNEFTKMLEENNQNELSSFVQLFRTEFLKSSVNLSIDVDFIKNKIDQLAKYK